MSQHNIVEIIKTLEKHSPDETSELGEAIVLAVEMLKREASRDELYYGAKLCPFCAGEATMRPEGDYWEITCDDCGVFKQGRTYEQALAEWNYRI